MEVDKVANMEVDMVANMEVDMVANMKVDMVADMKVDLVAGKVADRVANMVANVEVNKVADMVNDMDFSSSCCCIFCITDSLRCNMLVQLCAFVEVMVVAHGRRWLANATPPPQVSITPWFINMSDGGEEKADQLQHPLLHQDVRALWRIFSPPLNKCLPRLIWITPSVNTINQDHSLIL